MLPPRRGPPGSCLTHHPVMPAAALTGNGTYAGDRVKGFRVMPVIGGPHWTGRSAGGLGGGVVEVIEDRLVASGAGGLVVGGRVVVLTLQGGSELHGGGVEAASLADGLE